MTVSSTTRRSGPYAGNGVTTSFAYEFRILADDHISVFLTENGEDTLVDPVNYTVTNVGADNGGSVVFSTAPATGQSITILRRAPFTQEVDLENQGAFFAEVVEEALDLAAMRDQQLQEQLDRTLKISVGAEPAELDNLVTAVRRVSDNIDDVLAVSDVDADVSVVAGIAGDVTTVAQNVVDVTYLARVYCGPAASDPVTRRDGSPLEAGDFYFNTVTDLIRVYDGQNWQSSVKAAGVSTYRYVATSAQAVFSGADQSGAVLFTEAGSLLVTLNGVALIEGEDFAVTDGGNSITLTAGATLNDDLVVLSFDQLDFTDTISLMTLLKEQVEVDAERAEEAAALSTSAGVAQPFQSRSDFMSATIPVIIERASFVVSGQSYAVIRDASGPIAQANGQRWRPDGDITPQHFGAVGDFTTDSATAFADLVAYCNSRTSCKIIVEGRFRTTAPMLFVTEAIELDFTAGSVILFDNCDGISVSQTARYASMVTNNMTLLTNANNLHVGFSYVNTINSTGDQGSKAHTKPTFMGLDRYLQQPPYTNGWLTAASHINSDRIVLDAPYIQGAEEDRVGASPFPQETTGLYIEGCTEFVVRDPNIYLMHTGIKLRGLSEGFNMRGGQLVGNFRACDLFGTVNPANDWNIQGAHMSSFDYNIRLGGDVATIMHNITDCLLFCRPSGAVSPTFTHIICDARAQISGNYFHTGGSVDGAGHTAVNFVSSRAQHSQLSGNTLFRVGVVANIGAGIGRVTIHDNTTIDDSASLAVQPINDSSSGSAVGPNYGDRNFGTVFAQVPIWGRSGNVEFLTGQARNKGLSVTNVAGTTVNNADFLGGVAGSPAVLRTVGADANIDLEIRPKGLGALVPFVSGATNLGRAALRWATVFTDALRLGASNTLIRAGTGTPEGVIPAPAGSLFLRTNGGAGTTLYVKESGTGTTGWVAK